MYKQVLKRVMLPMNDLISRRNFCGYYRELEKSQGLPHDEIKKIQEKKLRFLIKHAYENVPYYHKKFRDLGLTPDELREAKDLVKLPILTKDDIRANFKDLIANNLQREGMIPYSTGGSTGEPLHFCITQESSDWGQAAKYRAYKWYGYEMGDKIAQIWGSRSDISAQQKLSNKFKNFLLRHVYVDAFNLSEEKLESFAQKLNKFNPKMITGYASALYLFAQYVKSRGILDIRPKVIVTQAEGLFEHQRRVIEEVFGEVYDFYGSREVGSIASECPEHVGYHISAENVIVEFVKGEEPVSSGEMGKILVTDFTNYAMPLIRYENGDIGKPTNEKCSCGINLPLMKSVEGRMTDIIVTEDKFISSPGLTLIFKDLPIKKYQVIQETRNEILIKIVKAGEYSNKHTDYLLEAMRNRVGDSITIDIIFVDSISVPASGKHRFIISKVTPPF